MTVVSECSDLEIYMFCKLALCTGSRSLRLSWGTYLLECILRNVMVAWKRIWAVGTLSLERD